MNRAISNGGASRSFWAEIPFRDIEVCWAGPACVAYLDSYQKTIQLGKTAYDHPEDHVPDEVPEQLVRVILAARTKGGSPPKPR